MSERNGSKEPCDCITRDYFDERLDRIETKIDKHTEKITEVDKVVTVHSALFGIAGTATTGGFLAWIGSLFGKH